jgi:hypothetical protein
MLQKMDLAPGLLASFVLIRTLSNVARTPLQSMGIVMGQEAGRRIAVGDLEGARRVIETTGRLFAVVSGLTSGLLLAGGESLTWYWTGNRELFDGPLMAAAAMPMVITPTALLAHNVLSSYQAPIMPAIARWAQLAITAIAYLAFSNQSPPVRMMISLSIGEVVGYAPVAYWSTSQLVPRLGPTFYAWSLGLVLACTLVSTIVTSLLLSFVVPFGDVATLAGFGAIAAIFGIGILFIGVGPEGRRQLVDQTIKPLSRSLITRTTPRSPT